MSAENLKSGLDTLYTWSYNRSMNTKGGTPVSYQHKPARTAKPATASKAVATYHGPTPAASAALAKSTSSKVSKAVAASAPSKFAADGRTFHVDDYRAASQLVKSLREGKPGAVKSQWVDALAASMAAVFEADSKQFGVPFSPAYFIAGTQ